MQDTKTLLAKFFSLFAGVALGLRIDILIAGFAGSIVAMVLLNLVPGTGDTWRELLRTTVRRMAVAIASSLTAGYLTPLAMLVATLPDALLLGGAFAVGGGAQQVLMFAIKRMSGRRGHPMTALQVLHFVAGFVVLAEALNKLERTAPCRAGLTPRERTTEWLKALAWSLLALSALPSGS
eukprot:gene32266-39840_t